MTNEQLFLKTLLFIQNKYSLSFKIKKDNRIKRIGVFYIKSKKEYLLIYNSKKLFTKNHTIYTAYHECGHIFNKLPYKTDKQKIYSEYMAERWALDKLKENSINLYKLQCEIGKHFLKIFKINNYEPYLSAWKQIYEYN